MNSFLRKSAAKGKHFVLTEKGYRETPKRVKHERAVGKPVGAFEFSVPTLWLSYGWVKEVEI